MACQAVRGRARVGSPPRWAGLRSRATCQPLAYEAGASLLAQAPQASQHLRAPSAHSVQPAAPACLSVQSPQASQHSQVSHLHWSPHAQASAHCVLEPQAAPTADDTSARIGQPESDGDEVSADPLRGAAETMTTVVPMRAATSSPSRILVIDIALSPSFSASHSGSARAALWGTLEGPRKTDVHHEAEREGEAGRDGTQPGPADSTRGAPGLLGSGRRSTVRPPGPMGEATDTGRPGREGRRAEAIRNGTADWPAPLSGSKGRPSGRPRSTDN